MSKEEFPSEKDLDQKVAKAEDAEEAKNASEERVDSDAKTTDTESEVVALTKKIADLE